MEIIPRRYDFSNSATTRFPPPQIYTNGQPHLKLRVKRKKQQKSSPLLRSKLAGDFAAL